jgi:hypothetical protein
MEHYGSSGIHYRYTPALQTMLSYRIPPGLPSIISKAFCYWSIQRHIFHNYDRIIFCFESKAQKIFARSFTLRFNLIS